MRFIFIVIGFLLLNSCASMMPAPASKDLQRVFEFDYQVESVDREELWVRARDYFAESFGDSRSVLRVQDREESTLIGRVAVSWNLVGNLCANEYQLRFESRDEEARLRLEILDGVPAYSRCPAWPWPTQQGYDTMVSNIHALASGLKKALIEGRSLY